MDHIKKADKDKIAVIAPIVLIVLLGIAIANIDKIFPTPSAADKVADIMRMVNYSAANSSAGTNPNASVTIIEFSDFQCPACTMAVGEVHKVMDYYGDKVNFVFKHFPVRQSSFKAAEAAECARDQAMFWEYHDILFRNSMQLDTPYLKLYARNIGLDMDEFNSCISDGRKAEKIKSDFKDGQTAGIKGTPTFFVNGIMLTGVHSFEEFRKIIDKELQK